jgi:hypothetical protein
MQIEVHPDPAEVGRARRWARARLAGSGIAADEPLVETLVLLISELVTNAVVHTGCPAVLRMRFPGQAGGAGDVRGGGGGRRETGRDAGRNPGRDAGPNAGRGDARGDGRADGDGGIGGGGRCADGAARHAAPGDCPVIGTVRVEVADASVRAPRPRHVEEDATNGRGLELVDGLADRWGWQPEGGGKCIWCEVDRKNGADDADRTVGADGDDRVLGADRTGGADGADGADRGGAGCGDRDGGEGRLRHAEANGRAGVESEEVQGVGNTRPKPTSVDTGSMRPAVSEHKKEERRGAGEGGKRTSGEPLCEPRRVIANRS